jgi:hypothetical protein
LVVEVDPGLAAFYRSLVPSSIPFRKPRWPPHITVVRALKEQPGNLGAWGRYEGQAVRFDYDPYIHIDQTYLWLNVWCDRLKVVREELGLPPESEWTRPPSGGRQCFHTTLGNMPT